MRVEREAFRVGSGDDGRVVPGVGEAQLWEALGSEGGGGERTDARESKRGAVRGPGRGDGWCSVVVAALGEAELLVKVGVDVV